MAAAPATCDLRPVSTAPSAFTPSKTCRREAGLFPSPHAVPQNRWWQRAQCRLSVGALAPGTEVDGRRPQGPTVRSGQDRFVPAVLGLSSGGDKGGQGKAGF